MEKLILAIDIGGTNIVFAGVKPDGEIVFRDSIQTRDFYSFQNMVSRLYEEAETHLLKLSTSFFAIGIGAPNGNLKTGRVEYAPNLPWHGIIDVKNGFEQKFGIPSFVNNDANAAAIGEMIFGNAKGLNDFVVITLGTGLGSGIVVNGELLAGKSGFGGEFGHTIVEHDGRKCGCGQNGCLETYASATGIKLTVNQLIDSGKYKSSLAELADASGKDITLAARNGDELAIEAFEITGRYLGRALANYTTIFDPEAIILFGGLSNAGDLLFEPTKRYMEQNLMPLFKNTVKIIPSALQGSDAALLGAAAWALKSLNKSSNENNKLEIGADISVGINA